MLPPPPGVTTAASATSSLFASTRQPATHETDAPPATLQARAEYDRSRKNNFDQRENAHMVQLGRKLDDLLKARASERRVLLEMQMAHERYRAILLDLQSRLADVAESSGRQPAGSGDCDRPDDPSPNSARRSMQDPRVRSARPFRSSSECKCDV